MGGGEDVLGVDEGAAAVEPIVVEQHGHPGVLLHSGLQATHDAQPRVGRPASCNSPHTFYILYYDTKQTQGSNETR